MKFWTDIRLIFHINILSEMLRSMTKKDPSNCVSDPDESLNLCFTNQIFECKAEMKKLASPFLRI